ncbi:NifB/NifX family molybdenum-iron cluster-binding protein [Methanococcus voltae]|uniref:Dinitrogenase iron-molybdenum cofactor biosynthesis protein n=1 Tax=Methanococcus voltae (strain ATCC BAA-1334 / A3) TaxID=456320 RepID=D7DT88_METV3|nr:NifB/NifX family molybdenum-iron cluster-binding protein [Methanococcus voltae]MCS3901198.1 putative Fe-Mo cluster-binding NifX family protein [Methanococcus voltae]
MKLAIPIINEKVSEHFGKSEYFIIYEINENNEVIGSKKLENNPCGDGSHSGHGSTVQTLLAENPDAVLFINMGQRSITSLAGKTALYRANDLDVENSLKEFLNGNLQQVQ